MSDLDIQFGELEEEEPEVELRPDRNGHYAVVPYENPQAHELPIFVELDVLIDMESHALTDTSVELGGVMLGGQLIDEEGEPYVLIKDSLRAEHYEATKGSFKFTHDTWQQISRQREEFPDDWDMVGWYHTHPDWGVFLSGMDMFICDNFFNKPLDVALVIDPCRQDRGLFQWTGRPEERIRRVSGFYVIASRHRQGEVEDFVADLQEGYSMRTDPNLRGQRGVSSSGGPTVVNISEPRHGWLAHAVVGLMVLQLLLILLVGYRVLIPASSIAASGQSAETLSQAEKVRVQTEVLDQVIAQLEGGDEGVVSKWQEERQAKELLETERTQLLLGAKKLQETTADQAEKIASLESSRAELKEERAALRAKWNAESERVKALETRIAALEGKETGKADADTSYAWLTSWPAIAGGVVLLMCIAAGTFLAFRQKEERETQPALVDAAVDEAIKNDPGNTFNPPSEELREG